MRAFIPELLAVAMLAAAGPAHADVTAETRQRAGAAFDAAVQHFQKAEYEEAAKAFLLADDLIPNSQALSNAIAAARKANDDLLAARAAQRAIERAPSDAELGANARVALSEAEKHLAKVELRCEPTPCSINIDSEDVQPGVRYLLPGTHSLASIGVSGTKAFERANFAAGARYRVVLYPVSADAAPKAAQVSNSDAPATAAGPAASKGGTDSGPAKKPLPPVAIYIGGGLTIVGIGVTTALGLGALSAKSNLSAHPTSAQEDAVTTKENHTNIAFAGTVVVGVATGAAALFLTDWGGGAKTSGYVVPTAGGALLGASGRFLSPALVSTAA